jgi:hypothetical protein
MVVLLASHAFAGPTTVKGRVVDEGCQVKELIGKGDLTAPTSMDACAVQCAKRGEPLALLTADGKVYRIEGGLAGNKNAKLVDHVNKVVEITGEITEKDGKATITADALKAR